MLTGLGNLMHTSSSPRPFAEESLSRQWEELSFHIGINEDLMSRAMLQAALVLPLAQTAAEGGRDNLHAAVVGIEHIRMEETP